MFRIGISIGVLLTVNAVSAATIRVPSNQPTIHAGINPAVDEDGV